MLTDKKREKLEKELGQELINELNAKDVDRLKDHIYDAERAIKSAQEELDANEQYQLLKEGLRDMQAGLKELKKRQNAIIQYSVHLLEDKG